MSGGRFWASAMLLAGCYVGAQIAPPAFGADVEYSGYTFRDPFESQLPAPSKEAPKAGPKAVEAPANVDFLRLSGVVWNSARPQAIINEHVVEVGGTVEGAEVVAIDQSHVGVRFKGKDFELTMGEKKGGQR